MLELQKKQYSPVYFLTGEEPYFIDKIASKIEKEALDEAAASFDQQVLYGRDVENIGQIIAMARQFPMMSERTVIILKEAQALKTMIANGVQGLIVEPSKSALPNPNTELYQEIRNNRIPLVFFNAKYPWADFPYVAMDDEAAGKTVTDYLFDCGHKRISGIFALDDIQGHKRYGGFMKSCIEHDVRTAEKDVLWFSTAERSAIFLYAQYKLLEMLHQSTAVVCYNDKLAINLLRFCRQHEINVPEDISIVGIDDSRYSSICEVPLTTVRHPHQVLGETAARMLIEQMERPKDHQADTIFRPDLVVRDSVRILGTGTQGATIQDIRLRG